MAAARAAGRKLGPHRHREPAILLALRTADEVRLEVRKALRLAQAPHDVPLHEPALGDLTARQRMGHPSSSRLFVVSATES